MKKSRLILAILALALSAAAGAQTKTPAYVPKNGGLTTVYMADGAVPCSPKAPLFGAKFDGVTDDTTADQAFITYVSTHTCAVQLPGGTSLISASLVVPVTQNLRFWGMCRICTTFKMATDNTPVFVFSGANTHSNDFAYFGVTWANQQTTAMTNAIAFQFTTATTDASGFYRNHFHDINIDRSNRTFAVTSAAGQETFWGNTIDDCGATNVTGSFYWAAPFTVIGMPVNRISGNTIFGYSPASVNTEAGPAFYEIAGEYVIDGNLIQNWNQEVLWGQGGGHVAFTNNHIENQSLASSSGRVFYFANGAWVVQGNSIAMIPGQTGLANAQVFGSLSAQITWDSNRVDAPVAATIGTWYLNNNTGSVIRGGNNVDTNASLTTMLAASLQQWVPGSQFAPALQTLQAVPQPLQGTVVPSTSPYVVLEGAYNGSTSQSATFYFINTSPGNWNVQGMTADNAKGSIFFMCPAVTSVVVPASGCLPLYKFTGNGSNAQLILTNGNTASTTAAFPSTANNTYTVQADVESYNAACSGSVTMAAGFSMNTCTVTGAVTLTINNGNYAGQLMTVSFCENATGGFAISTPASVTNWTAISTTALACTTQVMTWSVGLTKWLSR